MFNLFKKTKEEEKMALTDQIPIDNLKSYVVQGYDKEKKLEKKIEEKQIEIEQLKTKVKETDALKVVLENREQTIRDFEYKYKKVETLEQKILDTEREYNDQRIKNRELKNRITELQRNRSIMDADIKSTTREETKAMISKRIEQHKGNLSKATAIELVCRK